MIYVIAMIRKKICTWLLSVYPIIEFYSIPIVGGTLKIGNLLLVLLAYIAVKNMLLERKLHATRIDIVLLVFLFYTFICSFTNVALFYNSDIVDITVKYVHICCFFCVVFFRKYLFKTREMEKAFPTLAIIGSFAVISQFILFYSLGVSFYYVPETYRTMITNDVSRPSGLFIEPAHFSIYCVFSLFIILFKHNESKKKFLSVGIVIMAILMSKSTIGYISLVIVFFSYLLNQFNANITLKLIRRTIFLGAPILVIAIYLLVNYNLLEFVMNHMSALDAESVSSGNLRVLRGFSIWLQESFLHKIFGVGFANVKEYLISYKIMTIYDGTLPLGTEYMSAMSFILVMDGLVGLLLYLYAVYLLFKKSEKEEKILIVIFMINLISSEEFLKIGFLSIWVYTLLLLDMKKKFN